ncbi:AraC family transcription regulator protein [Herbaspirillum rubrisubalbicans M1]|uniref:AraC family transcriptional regulator n=1 Tax=Herbaspirillum rubrisubalbicans TaxID=80842 RepID=UPI00073A1CBD|nr:helix-turn-helix transcriptional regulator [Herbaspirillum rubrisubalbicans]ALU88773.1 AraC family transcription regulator protein [Herbaspirillum rubrisubalbicans M1]
MPKPSQPPLKLPIDRIDGIARPVVAAGADYPSGSLQPWHSHRRAQLLFGLGGLMQVVTQDGAWVVPPQHAVWIPSGREHQSRMLLPVTTCSAFVEPDHAPRDALTCQVLEVRPLLRELLIEATRIDPRYAPHSCEENLMRLLLQEIGRAREIPVHVPLPQDDKLGALCRDFMREPSIHARPGQWAQRLYMSERSFNRRFLAQTGMGFQQWRLRACVVNAISRLALGHSVTVIAYDLGYERPAAFSTMFRKMTGYAPSSHPASLGDSRRTG